MHFWNQHVNFENDLINLIRDLKFKNSLTDFQKKLKNDVKYINNSKKVFMLADKTTNVYEIDPKMYEKLLRDNITDQYKRADPDEEYKINFEAKKITDRLEISDRVEVIAKKEAYVTIKDHKKNFHDNPKCRLINPTKTQIGKISKMILQSINSSIREKTGLKQWRNTKAAIEWFKGIENKTRKNFIQLDIVNFYPSIKEELFRKAIEFSEETELITANTKECLYNARKSLLFSNDAPWTKKDGLFDVTMGAYDGAEVCELVGLYILSKLKTEQPDINIGLYRDDGLGVHKKLPGPTLTRKRKDIEKLFKDVGLEITIETNLTQVDFLDITMNLNQETFWPFRKENNETLYINVMSNHPKNVINHLPESINNRLSEISASKEIFNNSKENYQKALKNSGYNQELKYKQPKSTADERKKKRKRKNKNVIWYNPPFNCNLATNFGNEFLRILDKNFPKKHPLNKLLNRKTVKIGYSCTKNMKTIIQNHNSKILGKKQEIENKNCNCRDKQQCPMQGKCCTEGIVYKATLPDNKVYIGNTGDTFKKRFYNHKSSFQNERYKNSTTLSTYVWENQITPTDIHWSIVVNAEPYKVGQNTCSLCLAEKFEILRANENISLNKRNEIAHRCPHFKKFLLANLKPP